MRRIAVLLADTEIDMREIDLHPADAFVWDVAERNVLVLNGQWAGLVDQDTLLVGDRMMAPALARAALERLGCPWARRYETTWLNHWEAMAGEGGTLPARRRKAVYRVLFSAQIASKAGRVLPDGRIEPRTPSGLLDNLIRETSEQIHG